MEKITQSISIQANDEPMAVSFPNLVSAADLTFRDVDTVSMPSLSEALDSIEFRDTGETVYFLPNLTSIGDTIAIYNSPNLTRCVFPALYRIGGDLVLSNNTQYTSIEGFDALESVYGDLDIYGPWES